MGALVHPVFFSQLELAVLAAHLGETGDIFLGAAWSEREKATEQTGGGKM